MKSNPPDWKKIISPVAAIIVLITATTVKAADQGQPAAPPIPKFFDYTIYLHVASRPSGAEIYAPSESNRTAVLIGRTPCLVTVGFTWEERFGRKAWKTLHIWSKGNTCRAVFTNENRCAVFFSGTAKKPGYRPTAFDKKIALLKPPGFSWDTMDNWPREVRVQIDLASLRSAENLPSDSPVPSPQHSESAQTPAMPVTTMLLATGSDIQPGDPAELTLFSEPSGAIVFCDNRRLAPSPLKLILPPGRHHIALEHSGYAPLQRDITLHPGRHYRLTLQLSPAADAP